MFNDLVTSKKFIVAVLLTIANIVGYKLGIPVETLAILTAPLTGYIIAQGVADIGKPAAQVVAAQPASPSAALATKPPQAGFVRLGLMLVLTAIAVLIVACAWTKHEATTLGHDVVDCSKPALKDVSKQVAPVVEAEVVQLTTPDGKLQSGPVKQLFSSFVNETGWCVAAEVVNSLLNPKPPAADAPKSEQLVLDAASVRATFEELRREQFGGKTFKLADGTTL